MKPPRHHAAAHRAASQRLMLRVRHWKRWVNTNTTDHPAQPELVEGREAVRGAFDKLRLSGTGTEQCGFARVRKIC